MPIDTTTCPICGKQMQGQGLAEWPSYPFCSKRCRTIDLGRWLGEAYRIPREEPELASGEDETDVS